MSKRPSGEGSVYKRADGKWVGSISIGWQDGVLKRRKVVAATQAEVLRRLDDLKQRVENGATVKSDRLTVGDWLETWLETSAKPDVRPRTWYAYATITRRHLIPEFGAILLRKLEPSHIRAYMNKQRASQKTTRTVQHHHAILRRALNVAMADGLVSRNVAKLVTPPPVKRPEIVPMTADQVAVFLAHVRGDRFEVLYQVAMATGCRQSELLGLTWTDVDLDKATLRVSRTLQRYNGAYHLDATKTDKSRRTLALAAPVVTALRQHQERQRFDERTAGKLWQGQQWGLVFANEVGKPLSGFTVLDAFRTALNGAGLPPFRFHDLRHGAATFLLTAGVELKVVQEFLGHANINTTANVYAHVTAQLQRDAADKLGAVLFGASGS